MLSPSIILASNSPRRKALLKQINLNFRIIPADVHEDFSVNLSPKDFAEHFARLKAEAVAKHNPDHLVIGADTIVVLDNQILGKPSDRQTSFDMLTRLSERTHAVITGVSLQWNNKEISETFSETTKVTLQKLSETDIRYYIETYNPLDKAGSYGIQDWFSVCVKKVEGCFYNVVGFPLSAFYQRYKTICSLE